MSKTEKLIFTGDYFGRAKFLFNPLVTSMVYGAVMVQTQKLTIYITAYTLLQLWRLVAF